MLFSLSSKRGALHPEALLLKLKHCSVVVWLIGCHLPDPSFEAIVNKSGHAGLDRLCGWDVGAHTASLTFWLNSGPRALLLLFSSPLDR